MSADPLEPAFRIDLLEQRWLAGCPPTADLCSHGRLRVVIGGVEVSTGDEDYGVSETALGLLRTVGSDRTSTAEDERLVMHGCGAILMMGCPLGIDWDVRHEPGGVRLSNVARYDTTSDADAVRFPELEVVVPVERYAAEIVRLGNAVKAFFAGQLKQIPDEFDQTQYTAFWTEFDALLDTAADV